MGPRRRLFFRGEDRRGQNQVHPGDRVCVAAGGLNRSGRILVSQTLFFPTWNYRTKIKVRAGFDFRPSSLFIFLFPPFLRPLRGYKRCRKSGQSTSPMEFLNLSRTSNDTFWVFLKRSILGSLGDILVRGKMGVFSVLPSILDGALECGNFWSARPRLRPLFPSSSPPSFSNEI